MKTRTALIFASLLTGCVPPGEICEPGQTTCGWNSLPPLNRTEAVSETAAVDGVSVAMAPAGAAGWRLQILNNTDVAMSVLLDESSFVTSSGESGGRLINGNTRKMDVAKAQTPTPLPPRATFNEFVLVEKLVEAEENEAAMRQGELTLNSNRRTAHEKTVRGKELVSLAERNRATLARMLVGGKFYITVVTADGKKTWAGEVVGR